MLQYSFLSRALGALQERLSNWEGVNYSTKKRRKTATLSGPCNHGRIRFLPFPYVSACNPCTGESDCLGHVFPKVIGIRARDPMFGSFPTNALLAKRITDGFSTDWSAGNLNSHAHFGGQLQCPDTRIFAEGAWTWVQKNAEPFTPLGIQNLMGGVRSGGFGM